MAKKQLKKRPKKSTPVSSETLFNKTVVTIGVKSIDRHPENRQPKDTAIDEVVESIDQHGQLEPCLVRQVGRRYQMISGETRWLAVQRLGNKMIDCRVGYDIDDATALTLVAVANGARNDLDPIERAMLLQKLTAPTDEGGSGMTQEDAGKCISMSRSAVANSIRLLTLPDEIKTLIIKGELPESYAREALPLLTNDTSKPIAIKVIKDSIKHPDGLPGRSEFVEELEYKMRSKTRSLKFNSKPQAWQLSANSCAVYYATALFKPTSEQETKLGVVMVGKDKCCTNIKLWEKLQKEAAAKKSTGSKSKSSKPTKQLTPAQQRDAEEKKAQQLKRRIDTWAELWKRWWCSHELDIDVGSRIIAVFESESFGGLDEAIGVVVSEEGLPALRGGSDYQNLKKISELLGPMNYEVRLAKAILWPTNRDEHLLPFSGSLTEDVSNDLNFDAVCAWVALIDDGGDDTKQLLREFYAIFSKEMLENLAVQGGVGSDPDLQAAKKSKGSLVDFLLDRVIACPPCLQPKKKATAKKKAKKKASKKKAVVA